MGRVGQAPSTLQVLLVVTHEPLLYVPNHLSTVEEVGPGHVQEVVRVPFSVRDRDWVMAPT